MLQKSENNLNLIQKQSIQSEDIKQIVLLLNQPPLKQNLTLVGLDQLSTFDLGNIVFKIFKHLDSDINLNSKQTPPHQIIFQVTQFLKILNYDANFNSHWENGLLNGDRKVIYPICYFLLKNLKVLEKRAYLAKFLVPIDIPPEFAGQPELIKLGQQFKQLQAEFTLSHQQLQRIQSLSLNSGDLKKKIQKLQQQKQQLSSRVYTLKNKHGSKPEMAVMLNVTNMLRQQQVRQVRIVQKIQSYKEQLENLESQSMGLQQSLMDGKKSLAPSNSPQQMLNAIRNEVKKNRDIVRNRMTIQYNERLKKLQTTQKMLSQPPITQNELMMLENTMASLRREVNQMQQKLSKQTSKDDKLAIYKSQAGLVAKKKDQIQQGLKRDQQDMQRLQNEIRRKEEQINKLKGTGFKKNKLEDYLNEIKEKKIKHGKFKTEIQEIKWQRSILENTLHTLEAQKQRYEKQYGLVGGERVIADTNIQNASVEELNKEIEKILQKIRKRKNVLAPQLEEKKKILGQYENIQKEYKEKKLSFTGVTSIIQQDILEIQERVNKKKIQVYAMDTKLQLNKIKNQIIEIKMNRLNEEEKGGKKYAGYSSWGEYCTEKSKKNQEEIKLLTLERQQVSEKYNPSMEQKRYFADMKKLLMCKLQYAVSNRQDHKGHRLGNNVNVLKL